ncbi:hypothetical protein EMEDMD4_150186 [Sinorhizobium medicae]|uniref:Uncharacterized protein n=1 Tax=Sinorhizobium medicae TaxID=110321 RepID=A0A508WSB1_9HYPH|nr:hypothetical protein EMEDMD4_150186 [Sinorhizobium medicae]
MAYALILPWLDTSGLRALPRLIWRVPIAARLLACFCLEPVWHRKAVCESNKFDGIPPEAVPSDIARAHPRTRELFVYAP